MQPAHEKLAAQVSAQNPQRQLCAFWLAAVRLELGQLDQANRLLDSLDEQALEAAGADGRWGLRLQALRGLLLSKRDEPRAALVLLQSAVDGLQQKSATDSLIYEKARQALLTRTGNAPQGRR